MQVLTHHIELSQPRLIEGIAGRVDDMAQTILLRKYQHRVEETLHSIDGLDQTRTSDSKQLVLQAIFLPKA